MGSSMSGDVSSRFTIDAGFSLAWIFHECLCETCETEACRGFSHVRPTQVYWQPVEGARRDGESTPRLCASPSR